MNVEQFKAANTMEVLAERYGITLRGSGPQRMACCPFHEDKNASLSVNVVTNLFHCHGCGVKGDSIRFIALKELKTDAQVLNELNLDRMNVQIKCDFIPSSAKNLKPIKHYIYTNQLGYEVYRVVRYEPKDFRPWVKTESGHRPGFGNATRVLYNLPAVIKAETVWIVEGEKDADNLIALGYVATTFAGGAKNWLDSYMLSLEGKHLVICGDNDAPGKQLVETIQRSSEEKVKSVRIITLPNDYKDISDFIADVPAGSEKTEIDKLFNDAPQLIDGISLPLFHIGDIESRYREMVRTSGGLSLAKWLPSFKAIRPIIPGEVVLILGDTGTGKTSVLQNIARISSPMGTILFEMELPKELLFERFLSQITNKTCQEIEDAYRDFDESMVFELNAKYPNVLICDESRLTLKRLETIIRKSDLKFGFKPTLILIDYIQLLSGVGERRERISDAAEGLKVIARETNTIIVISSQITRPQNKDDKPATVNLHSAKESGSLENTAGMVIGLSRDAEDSSLLWVRVLKNTKGGAGLTIPCNFDGPRMLITERITDPRDIPQTKKPYND